MRKLVAAFAPTLKSAGYQRKAAGFRQEVSSTVTRLVNIQSSQWSAGSERKFTINLGVYHRDLAAHHDTMPVVESPLVQDCIVQQRIGYLMPVGRDFWWTIDPTTDLTALGEDVAVAWVEYGKPWLAANSTLEGAREHLVMQKHYFPAAMASVAMGKPDEASYWLDVATKDWPSGSERIAVWRSANLRL